MLVIGLISGTSVDGLDAALVDIAHDKAAITLRVVRFLTAPFDDGLRARLLALLPPRRGSVAEVCELNVLVGEALAGAAALVAAAAGRDLRDVALVASHGQTIYHQVAAGRTRSTLQIGCAATIAERSGCTVVSDFRARDIAAGGQGAPLVPFLDALLLAAPHPRVALNVGGIANITYLPAVKTEDRSTKNEEAPGEARFDLHPSVFILEKALAFDTGPGNVLLDCAVGQLSGGELRYDEGGAWAARGAPDERLLRRWLQHPFFRLPPPRSTGREAWGVAQAQRYLAQARARGLSPADVLATLTALTARSVGDACRRFLPELPHDLLVSGGGAHNRTLLAMLQAALPEARVLPMGDVGLDADAKEAVAFALLGYATVCGWASNVPGATGAARPAVLGSLTPGRDAATLLRQFAHAGPLPPRAVLAH
jgi:anhydro-N-acetylmuramic acid kinase